MIGAVGYWDVHPWIYGHKSGPKRWMKLYAYTLQAFGGTDLIMIGKNIPKYEDHTLTYKTFENLETALNGYPNARLVALSSTQLGSFESIPLKNYKHPEGDVLYIVGSDYGDIEYKKLEKLRNRCDFVKIESGEPPLWAHIALGIALYDRRIKSHGFNSNK